MKKIKVGSVSSRSECCIHSSKSNLSSYHKWWVGLKKNHSYAGEYFVRAPYFSNFQSEYNKLVLFEDPSWVYQTVWQNEHNFFLSFGSRCKTLNIVANKSRERIIICANYHPLYVTRFLSIRIGKRMTDRFVYNVEWIFIKNLISACITPNTLLILN